jgi:DNA polymerase III epsilon subunit-like protein
MGRLLFIDIETTGLDPRAEGAAILEVAWVGVHENSARLLGARSALCRPPEGAALTDGAAQVNGLSLELCRAYGATPQAVVKAMARLSRSVRVVAHYAPFERAWLSADKASAWPILRRPWLCSKAAVKAADALLGLSGSTSLGAACERYGVAYADAHTALGDALSCARLWAALRAQVVAHVGGAAWATVEEAAARGAQLELGVGR